MTTDLPISGSDLKTILMEAAKAIEAQKDYLCELDSEVGDGDHGVTMTIAMRAVQSGLIALQDPTPSDALRTVAVAFADEVGASVGPLYEVAFLAAAQAVEGQRTLVGSENWAEILAAMSDAIQELGGAQVGDKTLIDAWAPAARAARAQSKSSSSGVSATLAAAVQAAAEGVENTQNLIPKRGRASLLGERARGFKDAGASSALIFLQALLRGVEQFQRTESTPG